MPFFYSRWALLAEKFDQIKAAGDLLPSAMSADGEFLKEIFTNSNNAKNQIEQ